MRNSLLGLWGTARLGWHKNGEDEYTGGVREGRGDEAWRCVIWKVGACVKTDDGSWDALASELILTMSIRRGEAAQAERGDRRRRIDGPFKEW